MLSRTLCCPPLTLQGEIEPVGGRRTYRCPLQFDKLPGFVASQGKTTAMDTEIVAGGIGCPVLDQQIAFAVDRSYSHGQREVYPVTAACREVARLDAQYTINNQRTR